MTNISIWNRTAALSLLSLVCVCPGSITGGQGKPVAERPALDPLHQRVSLLRLKNETLLVGVAKLNSLTTNIGFSVELVPGTPGSTPPLSPKFDAEIEAVTFESALNWLCDLDRRYTWSRDGNTVNIFPRSALHDEHYFFNRRVPRLDIHQVSKPMEVVSRVVKPVSKPNESLVSWQGVQDFSKPLTATFANLTVRQALNRIAQHLGTGYGWLVAGDSEVMIFSFHAQIKPRKAATDDGPKN